LRLKGEVEVDEAYVPLGFKGQRRAWPRRRGGGGRRGRSTGRKKPFFTLVERGSRKALFLAGGMLAVGRSPQSCLGMSSLVALFILTSSAAMGLSACSAMCTCLWSNSGGVYAASPVHVNGVESKNWHLRAFLFFKRGISLFHASFYAFAASALSGFILRDHFQHFIGSLR